MEFPMKKPRPHFFGGFFKARAALQFHPAFVVLEAFIADYPGQIVLSRDAEEDYPLLFQVGCVLHHNLDKGRDSQRKPLLSLTVSFSSNSSVKKISKEVTGRLSPNSRRVSMNLEHI